MAEPQPEIGRLAPLPGWPLDWFAECIVQSCEDFPFDLAAPIMRRYLKDEATICSHYPWVAFAVVGYRRSIKSDWRARDVPPNEFAKILDGIQASARELDRHFQQIEEAIAAASGLGNWPKLRTFKAAKQRLLLVFGAGGLGEFPSQVPNSEARPNMVGWAAFLPGLARAAAEAIRPVTDDASARGGSGPRQPGVGSYVAVLASVWASAAGKKPSAEKVRSKHSDSADPPFVRFTKDLATVAAVRSPTRKTIELLLKTPR